MNLFQNRRSTDLAKHKTCLEKYSQDLTNSCGPIKDCELSILSETDEICKCLNDAQTCGFFEVENLCSAEAAKFLTRSFKIILISVSMEADEVSVENSYVFLTSRPTVM
jgi:hypothetical protein